MSETEKSDVIERLKLELEKARDDLRLALLVRDEAIRGYQPEREKRQLVEQQLRLLMSKCAVLETENIRLKDELSYLRRPH